MKLTPNSQNKTIFTCVIYIHKHKKDNIHFTISSSSSGHFSKKSKVWIVYDTLYISYNGKLCGESVCRLIKAEYRPFTHLVKVLKLTNDLFFTDL